jgi:hypothetical protein
VIELHAWRSPETCTFAAFIYEKGQERLLRHITGTNENETIRQAMEWCEKLTVADFVLRGAVRNESRHSLNPATSPASIAAWNAGGKAPADSDSAACGVWIGLHDRCLHPFLCDRQHRHDSIATVLHQPRHLAGCSMHERIICVADLRK